MIKKCLYTCITNKYDRIREPTVKTPGWDYICFTDDPELTSEGWEIRLVDNPDNTDSLRLSRRIKHLYHHYVPEYDWSIYVDANRRPTDCMGKFLEFIIPKKKKIDAWFPAHPWADCIYEEAKRVMVARRDDPILVFKQMTHYLKEGYPTHNGMVAGAVIVRRRGRKEVEEFFEKTYENILKWSYRDLLTFNYILWKHPINIYTFPWALTMVEGGFFHKTKYHNGQYKDTMRLSPEELRAWRKRERKKGFVRET